LEARWLNKGNNDPIDHILYDTRAIVSPTSSLFFAIKTAHSDGHSYLPDAYQKGVRNFIVDSEIETLTLTDANILLVKDSVGALQQLAAWHRKQFQLPVIGITGSNGKTIVKEWLYQLLSEDEHIVRSPKSYNSQIGVPVSVWQIAKEHTLGLFEAGISQAGEMENLAAVIQPTIGVLTNLGEAHDEGFASKEEKLSEKLKLFHNAKMVIGNSKLLTTITDEKKFTWGREGNVNLQIDNIITGANKTTISGHYLDYPTQLVIPFTDEASIENAITCWTVMLYFEYNEQTINERFAELHQVDMRLQLVKGINNCTIINDSYSADLTSLNIALHFLSQQKTAQQQTIILSDFLGSGLKEETLYSAIAEGLIKQGVSKVIGIGPQISLHLPSLLPGIDVQVYNDTDQFVQHFRTSLFRDETILVKGARAYQFERIVQLLETKVHQTVLEINLNSIAHNLKEYRKLLSPGTAIMAMVKAFSYGSGGAEIASILQFNKVDYLGVAYADEGVELRSAGIS
ncbi:MAG TPA: Mur ligase family protein, partial [Chitinophagaceae bacterium]